MPYVYTGSWDLADDECLLLEMTVPPVPRYWGIQTASPLYATLDHVHRHSSLTRAQTVADDDGKVRVILAHRDPGVPNWLDTLGHRQGILMFRIAQPAEPRISTQRLADTSIDWFASVAPGAAAPAVKPRSVLIPPPRCEVLKFAHLREALPANSPTVSAQARRAAIDRRFAQINRLIRS